VTSRTLLAAVIVLTPCVLAAQTPGQAPATETPAGAAVEATEAPAALGFTYSPEGRRDPFVSLMRRGVEPAAPTASRTLGLAGMAADDVSLRGVLISRDEFLGIVHGSDNKTYIVRAGQKLLDGTIRAIDKDAMVIMQRVTDPLALDKQRELRKAIRQDEAK
jgi:Tfp pilus assembly protein PilP